MKSGDTIPVIDIFAGPGGLSEGFTSLRNRHGRRIFKVRLSIESNEHAHRTLLLRSFYRQFTDEAVPNAYYEYLRGKSTLPTLESLLERFPRRGEAAKGEAWHATLGAVSQDEVDARISAVLGPRPYRKPWVLTGGPPCQAYSVMGRVRMLAEHGEQFYDDHRHTLYREYLRLISKHAPTAFVLENVKGLLSSKLLNGARTFELILHDLQQPQENGLRYHLFALSNSPSGPQGSTSKPDPRQYIVRAERHAIPQCRHRVIIIGLLQNELNDLSLPEKALPESQEICTVRMALDSLPKLRSGLSKTEDSDSAWLQAVRAALDTPWLRELNATGKEDVARTIEGVLRNLRIPGLGRGKRFIQCSAPPELHKNWFLDPNLDGVCNHEARSHDPMDLHRYLFVSSYGRTRKSSPHLQHFPHQLLPKHKNVERALKGDLFDDRFKVQLPGQPSGTITSHLCKDGHYFIHYDPSQCRSLTVREAARLQTFPDNYFFEGSRTEQYRQVGNAVPPLLARGIAAALASVLQPDWAPCPDG